MPFQLLLLKWGLSYSEFSVIWGPLCLFDACSYFEAFLKQKAKLSVISRPLCRFNACSCCECLREQLSLCRQGADSGATKCCHHMVAIKCCHHFIFCQSLSCQGVDSGARTRYAKLYMYLWRWHEVNTWNQNISTKSIYVVKTWNQNISILMTQQLNPIIIIGGSLPYYPNPHP